MAEKLIWVDRKFDFKFPASNYSQFIERLRKTPDRLERLMQHLSSEILVRRDAEKWSIQENAGHLMSVDKLFSGRLEDYKNNLNELRPADLSGKNTSDANFNNMKIADILREFRHQRGIYVEKLLELPADEFGKTAFHPRLKVNMRLCDMLYFQAEHDDHHLQRIAELINKLR